MMVSIYMYIKWFNMGYGYAPLLFILWLVDHLNGWVPEYGWLNNFVNNYFLTDGIYLQ